MKRTIFIYGLIVLAAFLFVVRMIIVNSPEPVTNEVVTPESRQLAPGQGMVVELPASEPGWRAVGRGPMTIRAEGKIDIGGQMTTPDDTSRPGDEKALAPSLPYGMLVARIGEKGEPFRVGKLAQIASNETIYLAINDSDHSDNSGYYTIRLTGGTKY